MIPALASEQTRALQLALAEGDTGWRILVQENPQPVLVVAGDPVALVAVNTAAAAFYGYSPAEMRALRITELIAPDAATPGAGEDTSAAPERLATGRAAHRRKDGSVVQVHVVSHELRLGGERACVAIVTDVTERVALQGQLRQAQKMGAIGQLAASVAHDFNNLLTAILASVEFAETLIEPGHEARADLEVITRAARRATELTRQLLMVSRKRPPRAEVLDLNTLIGGPVQLLQRLVGGNVELRVAAAPRVWPVRADAGQIEQVLLNLVVNARDAMPRGGTLTISTANRVVAPPPPSHPGLPAGEYAALAVRDTGIGMDDATLARVFEPFFTTKPPGRGTGLGLSTVYGIAKQWGGYVYGESAPGAGATFSMLLPRAIP